MGALICCDNVMGNTSKWQYVSRAVQLRPSRAGCVNPVQGKILLMTPNLPIPVVHVILCSVSGDDRITIKKLKGKQKEPYYYANFCFEDLFFSPNAFLLLIDLGCTPRIVLVSPRTEMIHCLTFLRTDMRTVKIVPPAFMQHGATASLSGHDPL